jgi:hypothetical protein
MKPFSSRPLEKQFNCNAYDEAVILKKTYFALFKVYLTVKLGRI